MNDAASNSPRKPHLIVTFGGWITGIGLILLALQCFVYPGVEEGYGVAPVDEKGFAYLLATGMRDLFLGITTIYLLLHFRASLPFFFLAMLIVPISDTLIVLRYGDSMLSAWPHVVGIIGLSVISFFAYHESENTKAKIVVENSGARI